MKKLLFLPLLMFAVSVFAQSAAPTDRAEIQQQLLRIEEQTAKANNGCDYDFFRKIEAAEFIFTDSQGNVITREEDLAGEKDCKPKDDAHEFDEPRLIVSPGAAVLNARHTMSGQRNGKPFRVQTRFTDVFVWRDGRWRMVAGHSSRIPQKP